MSFHKNPVSLKHRNAELLLELVKGLAFIGDAGPAGSRSALSSGITAAVTAYPFGPALTPGAAPGAAIVPTPRTAARA
jgi:hypothetical protein